MGRKRVLTPFLHPVLVANGKPTMPTPEALLQARQVRIDELHRLEQGRTALLVIDMQRGFRRYFWKAAPAGSAPKRD